MKVETFFCSVGFRQDGVFLDYEFDIDRFIMEYGNFSNLEGLKRYVSRFLSGKIIGIRTNSCTDVSLILSQLLLFDVALIVRKVYFTQEELDLFSQYQGTDRIFLILDVVLDSLDFTCDGLFAVSIPLKSKAFILNRMKQWKGKVKIMIPKMEDASMELYCYFKKMCQVYGFVYEEQKIMQFMSGRGNVRQQIQFF